MDFFGIQGIINRINEIESKIQSFDPPQASFQSVLESVSRAQAGPDPPVLAPGSASDSNQMVSYKGHAMTLQTAMAFGKLEGLLAQIFPGRAVTITSTTDGQHVDPNHVRGKAVDFVVEGLSREESRVVEELSRQAGFVPYNEYVHNSPYKTGDHMHVDLAG